MLFRSLKLLVGEFLECLQDFAVIWVNTFVGHGFGFFQTLSCGPDHAVLKQRCHCLSALVFKSTTVIGLCCTTSVMLSRAVYSVVKFRLLARARSEQKRSASWLDGRKPRFHKLLRSRTVRVLLHGCFYACRAEVVVNESALPTSMWFELLRRGSPNDPTLLKTGLLDNGTAM